MSEPDDQKPPQGDPPPSDPKPEPGKTKPTPPPAASAVQNGKTEREVELEQKLKAREMRINDLEDENRQLKQVTPAPPRPAPSKKSWLEEATQLPFGN
jgi:hypothetical protein